MKFFLKKIDWRRLVKNPLFPAIVGGVILVGALLWIISQNIFHLSNQTGPKPVPNAPASSEFSPFHPLTGQPIAKPLTLPVKVFSVMVENSADAWPLSGVEEAFLVIEAPVEGAIPRFEAFYSSDQSVSQIGPVRSARPYYLDWAEGFNALYAHVGGSPAALESIPGRSIADLNEFYQGEYFWRDHNRFAPHNTYTSSALLNAGANEIGASDFAGSWLEFASRDGHMTVPTGASTSATVSKIQIAWPGGGRYQVGWVYDAESSTYRRMQGTAVALSSAGKEYRATNVIVIKTAIETIDEVGRRQIATIGEGEAEIYFGGRFQTATWKKVSANHLLEFFDSTGQPIAFPPGTTWIEVVDSLEIVSRSSSQK